MYKLLSTPVQNLIVIRSLTMKMHGGIPLHHTYTCEKAQFS